MKAILLSGNGNKKRQFAITAVFYKSKVQIRHPWQPPFQTKMKMICIILRYERSAM